MFWTVATWHRTAPGLLESTRDGRAACKARTSNQKGTIMIDIRRPAKRLLWTTAAVALVFGIGARGAEGAASAPEILRSAGVSGGLVVHVGCGDAKLTAALRANDGFLVHGLDTDAANVAKARAHIRSLGLYGKVSVDRFSGTRLPYIDNLVNLVVAEDLGKVAMNEVMRVLAPGGVAQVKAGGVWKKTVKARPKNIDEWTHYMHDATNNAVARDTVVGPPRRMQWVGSPRWARHHDHMASTSALVSSGGRIFYIFDEGSTRSIQLPSKWFLIARDAFNGCVLWKRRIPLWHTQLYPLKSGPAQLPRRLVAVGERVYAPLGLDAPLSALDGATGKTLWTCRESKITEEVIAADGVLFVLAAQAVMPSNAFRPESTYIWAPKGRAAKVCGWDAKERKLLAVEAATGKVLWSKQHVVVPLTLAADGQGVFFHDGKGVVHLDRGGKQVWRSEPVASRSPLPTAYAPTLVVYKDVVLFAGGGRGHKMSGFDAATGKKLWTAVQHRGGHNSPEDVLVVDDLAWSGQIASGRDTGVFTGLDLHTGEVKREFSPDVKTYWFHHRCHRAKATGRFFLPSRTGIEFVDPRTKHWTPHHWVRGGCLYGVMPCNGLIYAPPHPCACYIESKLYGFNALAPAGVSKVEPPKDDNRLEKGPAYGKVTASAAGDSDWATYRGNAARSGSTKAPVPADLKSAWGAKVGGRLSSMVAAGGKVFVASIDHHTVHALDAASGKPLWRYTAGGRVDSPPTIWRGRVLFGSADGYVYCLRASDGEPAWRFRAAPRERRVVAFEQVESAWPVSGSVLVQKPSADSGQAILYCVAGRSMFLDGGLRLLQLDPGTGRKLAETVLDDRDPETGKNLQIHVRGLSMPVALPDVLSSDGKYLYMRSQRFDLKGARQEIAPRQATDQIGEGVHLFSTIGFLDDSWFHRSYWMYGRSVQSGWAGWPQAGRYAPSGRILVIGGSRIYGYARKPQYLCQSSVLEYQLYAADKNVTPESIKRVQQARRKLKKGRGDAWVADRGVRSRFPRKDLSAANIRWLTDQPPLQVRAMVLAGGTLFVAGPPDVVDEEEAFGKPKDASVLARLAEQDAALQGQKGGLMWAVSAEDGKKLAEYKLDAVPVFDGLIAANGRLYLATTDGKVRCYAGK